MSTPSNDTLLIVLHPFGAYAKGETISDAKTIASILSSGQRGRVVVTTRPELTHPAKTEF